LQDSKIGRAEAYARRAWDREGPCHTEKGDRGRVVKKWDFFTTENPGSARREARFSHDFNLTLSRAPVNEKEEILNFSVFSVALASVSERVVKDRFTTESRRARRKAKQFVFPAAAGKHELFFSRFSNSVALASVSERVVKNCFFTTESRRTQRKATGAKWGRNGISSPRETLGEHGEAGSRVGPNQRTDIQYLFSKNKGVLSLRSHFSGLKRGL